MVKKTPAERIHVPAMEVVKKGGWIVMGDCSGVVGGGYIGCERTGLTGLGFNGAGSNRRALPAQLNHSLNLEDLELVWVGTNYHTNA